MKAVNLIPSDQRAGGGSVTGDSEGGAFLVIGLLAGLAVLALMYGIANRQVSTRQSEVVSVTAEAQAAQTRAGELAPYVSFKALYQARLQAVSLLAGTRFDWAHAFHEIGRVLPADASLSSIHGTVGSATGATGAAATPAVAGTVASATPPGTVPSFSLAGCATSQSEVAEVLQRLRLIDGVSAVTLQSSTKATTGGGGGGGSSSGTCPSGDPAFAAEVTFSPLPTPAAAPGASTTTAAATSSSTTSPSSTSSAGGAQ